MEQSPKWALNREDLRRWLKNAVIFFAPVAVIYLGSVSLSLQNGFSWDAFYLNSVTMGAISLYVVNTLTDLLRKFAGSPSTVQG